MEIDCYRYTQIHRSTEKFRGKTDIPRELADKWASLQPLQVVCTVELLRTGAVTWYLEHAPTQFTLAILVTDNTQDPAKHADHMRSLFAQIDAAQAETMIAAHVLQEQNGDAEPI